MSGRAGQAPDPGDRCALRRNRSFGTDLAPCMGLRALIRAGRARLGRFDDLRLGQTHTRLVLTPKGAEPALAEACPACGAPLDI